MLKMYITISFVIAMYDIFKQLEGKRNQVTKVNLIFFPSILIELLMVKTIKLYFDNKK